MTRRKTAILAEAKGVDMKLAEALAERTELQRKAEQLRARITANARYQEGESPSEDAVQLLGNLDAVFTELERLIARINTTNAALVLGDGRTMTEALARRDVLRLRHAALSAAAAAGSGQGQYRQLRSELREIAAVDVPALRTQADSVARELREIDGQIQEANWLNELT